MISSLLDRLFGTARQLKQANERLRREVAAHEATLRELEAAHGDLERRVAERTRELSLVSARFETALRAAKVYVFSQDRDLRYTWVYSPHGENAGAAMLGRTDPEILPQPELDSVVAMKHRVLATGVAEEDEVSYVMPEGRALFALHIDPIRGPDNRPLAPFRPTNRRPGPADFAQLAGPADSASAHRTEEAVEPAQPEE